MRRTMSESPSRFGWVDALVVVPIVAGIPAVLAIHQIMLPRIRADVALGIANSADRLPASVKLLYGNHAALAGVGMALSLLVLGLTLRVLLWRKLGRAMLIVGCLVAPLFYAMVVHGAARATEIAFGSGLSVCRCPAAMVLGVAEQGVRCGCDGQGRVRVQLVPKSNTAYDGDARVRYEYDAEQRRVRSLDIDVVGAHPYRAHHCSYDPALEPDQVELRPPRCNPR